MNQNKPTPVLISDFDGTMTRHDFYQLVGARWWNETDTDSDSHTNPDPWEEYRAGRITHFDALNRYFQRIRADESSLQAVADAMELDPTLPAALERLHAAGWALIIVSAGCDWYIRYLLAGVRIPYVLHANPGHRSADGGLQMLRPVDSPFYSAETGIDKVAVVRDALARHHPAAFVGDGPPDVAAAKLVPPAFRFARGYLAEALRAAGEPYRPLLDWETLVATLLEGSQP